MKNKKLLAKELPVYEVPQVTSYTDEEILEELGPALAVTSPTGVF